MVGVGATIGTLAGGYSDAARSTDGAAERTAAVRSATFSIAAVAAPPQTATRPTTPAANPATASAAASISSAVSTTVIPAARATPATPPEPAPTSVIAMRFPTQWQQPAAARAIAPNHAEQAATQAIAFAAQPQPVEPVRPAAASTSGFQLASVDPAATPTSMPKSVARPAAPKPAVLFNDAQLASIKARLKLTRDQEQHWPQVEQALRAISWKLATQQKGRRVVSSNQAAMIDPNSPEVAKLKSAAFPLIMSLREDQKREVRQLAHTMGLRQVASMF
jgi:hypothetical protein